MGPACGWWLGCWPVSGFWQIGAVVAVAGRCLVGLLADQGGGFFNWFLVWLLAGRGRKRGIGREREK